MYSILLVCTVICFYMTILKVSVVFEQRNANCLPLNMSYLGSKIIAFDLRFLCCFLLVFFF